MNVFVKPNERSRTQFELCHGEKTTVENKRTISLSRVQSSLLELPRREMEHENKRKNSTVMKRPYDAMKPLGRLLGVFALLLSTGTICLCCSSDPATPDAPAEEGGGI